MTGLELRGCWTERPSAGEIGASTPSSVDARGPLTHRRSVPARDFVPIDDVKPLSAAKPAVSAAKPAVPAAPFLLGDPTDGWEARTSLFGELER